MARHSSVYPGLRMISSGAMKELHLSLIRKTGFFPVIAPTFQSLKCIWILMKNLSCFKLLLMKDLELGGILSMQIWDLVQ